MGDLLTENTDESPSAESVDIVHAASTPTAATAFFLNLARIKEILRTSEPAIVKAITTYGALHEKVLNAPAKTSEKGEILPRVERQEDGMFQLSVSEKDAKLIVKAISEYKQVVDSLPYYLANMLCMAAWSAFEGYIQAFLAEIFTRKPELLSSEKKISYSDALASMNSIVEFLAAKEIEYVGHLSFENVQIYLKSKVNIQFSAKSFRKMNEIYFLRNVLSHAAGRLRSEQMNAVPANLIVNGEIQISSDYLNEALDCLAQAVRQFNTSVKKRYDI